MILLDVLNVTLYLHSSFLLNGSLAELSSPLFLSFLLISRFAVKDRLG